MVKHQGQSENLSRDAHENHITKPKRVGKMPKNVLKYGEKQEKSKYRKKGKLKTNVVRQEQRI